MKLFAIASLAFLAACGVKGPPERPSGAQTQRTLQERAVIRRTVSTEAPAAPVAAPKPERRFVLDGLL